MKVLGDDYAVVIRTLGTGGDKYELLLKSLQEQTCPPKHIYVIIAEGYSLPKERIGTEEFVYTTKGMWHQRIFGLQYASKIGDVSYILALDDDLSFNYSFAEDSIDCINERDCDILIPSILDPNASGQKVVDVWSLRNLFLSLQGVRFESRRSKYRIKIAPTAGYIANTRLEPACNPTQSGQFAAFWIKADRVAQLELEEEYWIDDTKYALPDDQVFFYKAFVKGLKLYNHNDIVVRHLDHGSSNPNRLLDYSFATGRNFLIFWHRFLYLRQKSLWHRFVHIVSILYRLGMGVLMPSVQSLRQKKLAPIRAYIQGVVSAVRYISSPEYKKLHKL